MEDFLGKTSIVVKLDFRQDVPNEFMRHLRFPDRRKGQREEYKADQNRKFGQQINRIHALAMTQDILIEAFLKNQFHKAIQAFDQVVQKTREIIRPERSVMRNKKSKKHYVMNYKKL